MNPGTRTNDNRVVVGNDWSILTPPAGVVSATISVVIPAHCSQETLDLCLGALEQQKTPTPFEVVIVDHRSPQPLALPETTLDVRLHRLEEGHGPGAARAFGAEVATGDILVFQDVDILADRDAIWQYASVPISNPYAISLGFREFIDPEQVNADSLTKAIASGDLSSYLSTRQANEGQPWIDDYLTKTKDNLVWRDDLWIVVVGAGLGVSRLMYNFAGGFRDFKFHGVEDTEFGWRLFQAGAVVVPNRNARGFHIGLRSISRHRELINMRREGTLANLIPHSRFRPTTSPRSWQVPELWVHLAVDTDSGLTAALRDIDNILASAMKDLAILVDLPADGLETEVLRSHYSGDKRVHFLDGDVDPLPESTPFLLRMRPGLTLAENSIPDALRTLKNSGAGLLAIVAGEDAVSAELWRTAALARARLADELWQLDRNATLREAYGELWHPGKDFGIGAPRSS